MVPSPPAPAGSSRPFVGHPERWRVVETQGLGRFVTRVLYEDEDGARYEWTSRRHRKGLGLRRIGDGANEAPPAVIPTRLLNRWIGALFMIGAFCFAIGSLPGYAARVPDPELVGITFFVGSIFFTSAAGLQHVQTVRADRAVGGAGPDRRPELGYLIEPGRLDWWATAVQFAGTLFFNVTTFAALNDTLDTHQQIARVWAPDAFGSVCFLVASYFAVIEVCHGRWCWWRRDAGWRISALNMLGSVFFGISALTSFILPDSGEVVNAEATNLFTFLGAVCFFWGAYLLLPEAASAGDGEPARAPAAPA
jgi:hypothetical protein